MTVVRRVARPMLASIFISGGVQQLRDPQSRAKVAEPITSKLVQAVPFDVPDDPVTLVRVSGAANVLGGLMLASGRMSRLGALVLAADLVPTTLAGHRFWEYDDPQVRANQQTHFMKNVALVGGLLIAAADTGGKPSIGWRARRAGKAARRAGKAARPAAKPGRQAAKLRRRARST